MAQPTPYDRITNFQNDQALAPTDPYPAEDMDAEYNAIKITTDEIIQNLDLIQRDDGALENSSVGRDQLKDEVLLGFGAPEPWVTAHAYINGDTTFNDNAFWYCEISHTSTVFATDLAAGKWSLIADFTAAVTLGAAMFVSEDPPASPANGQQWFESDTGNTYLWYEDGDSGQWVQINGVASILLNQELTGNFWEDSDGIVNRIADRLFVGQAVDQNGNRFGTQGPFFPSSAAGANWAIRDSDFLSISSGGMMAVTGISRSSDNIEPAFNACIGVSGFVVNDRATAVAWGMYSDIQHEPGATSSYGAEFAIKNKSGVNSTPTPYTHSTGAHGIWMVGGGDVVYGGSPTHPSAAGMVFLKNASTWNTGIIFRDTSITGTDGLTGTGTAIAMARGHTVVWYAPTGASGASVRSDVDDQANRVQQLFEDNSVQFYGANSNRFFQINHVASGVNFINITNAVAAAHPIIAAAGSDTNIDLTLTPKGTGNVKFGTLTASADAAVSGYITIKDAGGTARKLAVIT